MHFQGSFDNGLSSTFATIDLHDVILVISIF